MSKRALMIILAVLFAIAGFATSNNLLGARIRTVTVHDGDAFYTQPSLTAASCTAQFNVGDELLIVDEVKLMQPTAAVMLKTLLLEDKEHTKYKLAEGAVYKIADARLDKPAASCLLALKTTKGLAVELEVPRDALRPVDEGTWLHVRNKKTKQEGWLRSKTQWY